MRIRLILLIAVLFGLGACVPTKRLTYLQESEGESREYQLIRSAYKVQINDILNISIRSFDTETNEYFNVTSTTQNNALNAGDILFYLQGYSVDLNGQVQIPVLGSITVANKTIAEIQTSVEEGLRSYFSEEAVHVSVRLAGVRFSIVGEEDRPGKFVIYQNQVNIFEALALAGDITIVGDRQRVMIVRQRPEKTETFYLDLTDAKVINDVHYFIQPNDIINVQPLRQKSLGIGTTGFQTFSQLFSLLASTITLIIAINSLN
jgi:polysaccharide biosynthesis/export protein